MKNFPMNKPLLKGIYEGNHLHNEILSEITKNGIDYLDFWDSWEYKQVVYDVNVFDYEEFGQDVICVVAYPCEKIDGAYITDYGDIAAKIYLHKKEWKRREQGKSLYQSCFELTSEIQETCQHYIEQGFSYQFDDYDDNEAIKNKAEQIGFLTTSINNEQAAVGYVMSISQYTIEVLTDDWERKVIDFRDLSDNGSKLIVLDLLLASLTTD